MYPSNSKGKVFLTSTEKLGREYFLTIDVLCNKCQKQCDESNGLATHLFDFWHEATSKDDFESAIDWFTERLHNHPTCIMSKVLKGVACLNAHKFQECIDECSILLVQFGNIESILFIRAIASLELGKTESAIADVKTIISEYDNDTDSDDKTQALHRFSNLIAGLHKAGRDNLAKAMEQILQKMKIILEN
jgi:lipopolysaccharide biosynthesis regulator YciM